MSIRSRASRPVARVCVLMLALSIATATRTMRAQQSTDQSLPRFEVASVKPSGSDIKRVGLQTLPGGRFTAENVTLRALVQFAYGVQPQQVVGGASWLDADRFDIIAKADANVADQFDGDTRGAVSPAQLMLRALLADRFKLQVHTESRDLPIFALVVRHTDGTLGPQIKTSQTDCSPTSARASAECGIRMGKGPGTLVATGVTMRLLAGSLTPWVGRLVVDETNLKGSYDLTLNWAPDQMPEGLSRKIAAGGLPPADPNGASIYTAVQEQLGLKLDSRRGPVDVIVIDRADHPAPN